MDVQMRSLPIETTTLVGPAGWEKAGAPDDSRQASGDGPRRGPLITGPNAVLLTLRNAPVKEPEADSRRAPQDVVRLSNKARMALAALEVLKKLNGDDINLTGQKEADIIAQAMAIGTDGNDHFQLLSNVIVAAGAGDDTVEVQDDSAVDGGDGNDSISAYHNAVVAGGAGHDRISAYDDARLDGGDGDDVIDAYDRLVANGGAGNDRISAYHDARVNGGDGDDTIDAYERLVADGGAGNDWIMAYEGSRLSGGAGNDTLHALDSELHGGDGDDVIGTNGDSTVSGGAGNDRIGAGSGVVHYNKGDGHDLLYGGRRLIFGEGISASDISVELSETGHVRIVIGEGPTAGSITLDHFDGRYNGSEDWMIFQDGSKLNLHQKVREEIGLVMTGRIFFVDPNAVDHP